MHFDASQDETEKQEAGVQIGKKPRIQWKAPKYPSIPDPLGDLREKAEKIAKLIIEPDDEENKKQRFRDHFTKIKTMILKSDKEHDRFLVLTGTLNEILVCQLRFLLGIYLSIFLQEDYKDIDLDRRVSNYLNGIGYCSYYELMSLCEQLKKFFERKEIVKGFEKDLFSIKFNNIRLKAQPHSNAHHNHEYSEHLIKIIRNFHENTEFLKNSTIEIAWRTEKCKDDRKIFEKNTRRLLRNFEVKNGALKNFWQYTGECRLRYRATNIRLDPIIIPLSSRTQRFRFAMVVQYSGLQSYDQSRVTYRELSGAGDIFTTNDTPLYRDLYWKKGLVLESPSFSYEYFIPGSVNATRIQLYDGDIFDLNFHEKINLKEKDVRSAMLNICYTDPTCRTQLHQSLVNLAGESIDDDLLIRTERNENLDKNKVYPIKVPNNNKLKKQLNFDWILHCPIYSIKKDDVPTIDTIKSSIKNILKECLEKDINWLVAPAMGALLNPVERKELANKWCDSLNVEKNSLERIIFAFINREACNDYRKCFEERLNEKFSRFHYPVSRMYKSIFNATDDKDRIYRSLSLCIYLYSFMVAWSLRSLMWERNFGSAGKSTDQEVPKSQSTFIRYMLIRAGIENPQDAEEAKFARTTGFTSGVWRSCARAGHEAIKNTAWNFESFLKDDASLYRKNDPDSPMNIFLDFLNGGNGRIDIPFERNVLVHDGLPHKSAMEYAEKAEKLVGIIESVITSLAFLNQNKNALIYMESFSVDEDCRMGQLIYRDIGGGDNSFPLRKKQIPLDELKNTHFESGCVYLYENIKDHEERFLNMHPFMLYGPCSECGNDRLLFWYNFCFDHEDKDRIEIDYKSTDCHCEINRDTVAGKPYGDLTKRLKKILKELSSGLIK